MSSDDVLDAARERDWAVYQDLARQIPHLTFTALRDLSAAGYVVVKAPGLNHGDELEHTGSLTSVLARACYWGAVPAASFRVQRHPRTGGPQMRTTFEVSEESGGLQLSVNEVDDANGAGSGYRIFGPKFAGSSRLLREYTVTERDAREVIAIMQRVIDRTQEAQQ